jgi:hypothetical protein
MDDESFAALQLRVARLVNQAATATEELLAEIQRRAAGGTATVHEIRPTLRPGDDDA